MTDYHNYKANPDPSMVKAANAAKSGSKAAPAVKTETVKPVKV